MKLAVSNVEPLWAHRGERELCEFSRQGRDAPGLAHQEVHDPLSALPKRTLSLDRIGQALARLKRQDGVAAVVFLEGGSLKVVNHSLGIASATSCSDM